MPAPHQIYSCQLSNIRLLYSSPCMLLVLPAIHVFPADSSTKSADYAHTNTLFFQIKIRRKALPSLKRCILMDHWFCFKNPKVPKAAFGITDQPLVLHDWLQDKRVLQQFIFCSRWAVSYVDVMFSSGLVLDPVGHVDQLIIQTFLPNRMYNLASSHRSSCSSEVISLVQLMVLLIVAVE